MSSRDTAFSTLAAGIALAVLIVLTLYGGFAKADDALPGSAAAGSLSISSDICQKADQEGMPPPPGIDCTDYQVRLEQQAKRMESQAKILEQQAKRFEILAKIQTAKGQPGEKKASPSDSTNPANPPNPPLPPFPQAGVEQDRVLEVFGNQARIRYRGGEILVRQGQSLPRGGLIGEITTNGVTLIEGQSRQTLPFYIGEGAQR